MFDTHVHLQEFADVADVIARARAAGVARMLLAGVGPDGWERDDALAAAHDGLAISYGLHPQLVHELDERAGEGIVRALDERLAARSTRVVCVGEIGLDAVDARRETLEKQARLFRAQLAVARQHRLPVALHVLRAHPQALGILRDEGVPHGGVLHSCSASPELTREYVALGLHVSFSGSITWHGGDNKAARAARLVPTERLLVETDAPDQTPEPERPGRNEPAFLVAIVRAIAQILALDFADVARLTDENARRLFNME